MSLLDDVSIVVTPNGYKAGELYAVIPVPTYGAEEVTNGDFDGGTTGWILQTPNWAYGSNNITSSGSGGNQLAFQTSIFEVGKNYNINFEITSYTSGILRLRNNSVLLPTNYNLAGEYTLNLTASEAGFLGFQNYSSFIGTISNVSVKEYTSADMDVTRATAATRVDENGLVNYAEVLGGEEITCGDFSCAVPTDYWTAANAVISFDNNQLTVDDTAGAGSDSRGYQVITTEIGKTYRLTFNRISTTSVFWLGVGNTPSTYNNVIYSNLGTDTGEYTVNFTAISLNTTIAFISGGNGITVFSNISVKEVTRANVPRIDYTGGGCPHILAEPQRTNLITYSEDYTSGWIPYQASVNTNEVISPDGSLNADKIIENTANSTHFVAPIVNNIPSSGTATLSVFAKKGENNWIKLVQYTNYVNFDLNNGVVGNSSAISSSIINYGNGWYKCIMNFNIGGSGANVDFKLGENNTSNWDDIYTGDGTSGVYIYGAQLEVGSYATSYIPTSGSTVTRNQDIFTRDGIGSLINSTEGVLFAEIAALTSLVPLNNWLTITDGTASNQVAIGFETNAKTTVRVDVGGVLQAYITVSGDYSQNRKLAFKWKENDFALWIDGVEVGVDTSGATLSSGTLNSLQFNWGAGGNYTNAKVKQLQVYDTSLSDTQLAALTT